MGSAFKQIPKLLALMVDKYVNSHRTNLATSETFDVRVLIIISSSPSSSIFPFHSYLNIANKQILRRGSL